jgi:hypothetical protein
MFYDKPRNIVDEGDEDTKYKESESLLGDTISIEHHEEPSNADGQVEKVWT